MADGKLTVTIVTPKGAVADRTVDSLIAPGALGEFCVLPGHSPLLTGILPGVATLVDGGKNESFAVGTGYLQVGAEDTLQVLANEAQAASDVDVDQARLELATAVAALKAGIGDTDDRETMQARAAWAQARVDAAAKASD